MLVTEIEMILTNKFFISIERDFESTNTKDEYAKSFGYEIDFHIQLSIGANKRILMLEE